MMILEGLLGGRKKTLTEQGQEQMYENFLTELRLTFETHTDGFSREEAERLYAEKHNASQPLKQHQKELVVRILSILSARPYHALVDIAGTYHFRPSSRDKIH